MDVVDPDDRDEDVLSFGPGRAARAGLAVLVLVATAALAVVTLRSGSSPRPIAAPPTPRPPTRASVSAVADNQYLIEVPAADMSLALAAPRCRRGCVAFNLSPAQLHLAAESFAGLHPLAGGLVRGPDHAVLQESVEGLAEPDALVHLMIEPIASPAATRPRVQEIPGDGFDTITVAQDRGGWRFTATIVVRGTAPPVAAARAWVATAVTPG